MCILCDPRVLLAPNLAVASLASWTLCGGCSVSHRSLRAMWIKVPWSPNGLRRQYHGVVSWWCFRPTVEHALFSLSKTLCHVRCERQTFPTQCRRPHGWTSTISVVVNGCQKRQTCFDSQKKNFVPLSEASFKNIICFVQKYKVKQVLGP